MAAAAEYLRYTEIEPPSPGESVQLAEQLQWVRMPLPFMLGHINLWMLGKPDATTIVDTGLNGDETQSLWRKLLSDRTLESVVITHMHPDHVGSAGWLVEHYNVPLYMSRAEYLMCRVLVADTGRPAPEAGVEFYRRAGFDETALQRYRDKFGIFGKAVYSMPDAYRRIYGGDRFTFGDTEWLAVETSGHCPEHISFFDEDRNLFIAGDQLLPTISSNVSVWPTEPEADPLGHWIRSCRKLIDLLDDDTLVLPSHGKPFKGAPERLQALIDEHDENLNGLQTLCQSPKRVIDTFELLFRSRINEGNLIMATGEARAHLNYLVDRDVLAVSRDDNGVDWFETRSAN
ncbi:MAG: MBL fold metallo-hydrolase [Pseudomonadota bacterium]